MLPGLSSAILGGRGKKFPTVVGTATNELNNGSALHPVNLPSGNPGDLLIIFLVTDSASTFTNPSGWSQLYWTGRSSSNPSVLISYRWATGTEGSTVSVPAGGSGGSPGGVNASIRIRGSSYGTAPQITIFKAGTTASPNPPALTPTFGSGKHLWITSGLWSGSRGNISAYPTGYNLGQAFRKNSRNYSSTWGTVALAARQYENSTENPGAFTVSAASIAMGVTIAVKAR